MKTLQIYTEITPNPLSLKFVTEKILFSGAADFPTKAEAETSPFASAVYQLSYVNGVFFSGNFVTVTKSDAANWEEVIPEIKDNIRKLIESNAFIAESSQNGAGGDGTEAERKIRMLIDEQVRPAVAMDGGDIIYEGFDDGVVKLKLRGSCSGCPSSTFTLKAGIEALLMRMVPEVKSVEAV